MDTITLSHRRSPALPLLIALLALLLLCTGAAQAQSGTPVAPAAVPAAAGEVTADQVTADEVNVVARELWCPLCSGVRLDSCELKACEQMKDEIGIKLAEGQDLETIKSYFVDQYGPQVLGVPPAQGFNLLAWILPVVVLVAGAAFLLLRGRSLTARPAAASSGRAAASPAPGEDPYARRLEEELERYD